MISVGEDVEKRERLCTVRGNVNWLSHYGEHCVDSSTIQNRTTILPSNPLSKGDTNRLLKRHMYLLLICNLYPWYWWTWLSLSAAYIYKLTYGVIKELLPGTPVTNHFPTRMCCSYTVPLVSSFIVSS